MFEYVGRKKKGLTYRLIKEEDRQSRPVVRKALFDSESSEKVVPAKKARRSKSLEDGLDDADLMVIGSPPQVRHQAVHERSPFRLPEPATPQRAAEAPDGGFVYQTPQRTPLRTPLRTPGGSIKAGNESGSGTPWSSRKRLRDAIGKSIGKVRRALLTPVKTINMEPRYFYHFCCFSTRKKKFLGKKKTETKK